MLARFSSVRDYQYPVSLREELLDLLEALDKALSLPAAMILFTYQKLIMVKDESHYG